MKAFDGFLFSQFDGLQNKDTIMIILAAQSQFHEKVVVISVLFLLF